MPLGKLNEVRVGSELDFDFRLLVLGKVFLELLLELLLSLLGLLVVEGDCEGEAFDVELLGLCEYASA